MKIVSIKNNQDSNLFRIEYMLGNLCNHRCHYCFPGSNEGNEPWPNLEIAKQNFSHLLEKYKEFGKTKASIFFVGGEPTLWKGLSELCGHLKENYDVILEISSNGSRSVDWWKENGKNFDHIGISVHREYANLDHIVEVCDTLYKSNVFVNADVLMDPDAFDKCCDMVEYLKSRSKNKWPIIAKVVNFNGKHRYTQEQLKYFEDSIKQYPDNDWYINTSKKSSKSISITDDTGKVITVNSDSWFTRNQLNYFNGWECNLGIDFVKIYSDGTISSNCREQLYRNTFDYNLYDTDFTVQFNPKIQTVMCSKQICQCNEEMVLTKSMIFPK